MTLLQMSSDDPTECSDSSEENETPPSEPVPERPKATMSTYMTTGPSTSVSGQLSVSNLSLYALIDSVATHSYIASRLCDKLEGNRQIFSTHFITITPTSDACQSTTWYKDVPIKVQ